MVLDQLKRRLKNLECRSRARDVTLIFADGSTRAIRVLDPLDCLCAAFTRRHARITGKPIPQTRYDAVLELLARSESLDSNADPLLFLAKDAACETVVTT